MRIGSTHQRPERFWLSSSTRRPPSNELMRFRVHSKIAEHLKKAALTMNDFLKMTPHQQLTEQNMSCSCVRFEASHFQYHTVRKAQSVKNTNVYGR
jgi:hypothetical protein